MSTNDDETCPFCRSRGRCPHLLLVVDQTFRTADAGPLANAFSARWAAGAEADSKQFDERWAFEQLLDEVDALADASTDHEYEGGPGMSSRYTRYFARSQARAEDALTRFSAANELPEVAKPVVRRSKR